ncbi:MAG: hypothetical protein IJC51_04655 [Eggerthellaceae bacterium]|nr:hypothetical protein [Eggerthellaceae bacterium]
MAFGGKRNRAEIVHRADASMHDYYGAMGETADFEEAFEPDAPAVDLTSSASFSPSFSEASQSQSSDAASASSSAPDSSATPSFARFQLLYESRDGKMAVFEDEHGHIVAVDTARLA